MGAAHAEVQTHIADRQVRARQAASAMLGDVETHRRHQIGAPTGGGASSSSMISGIGSAIGGIY